MSVDVCPNLQIVLKWKHDTYWNDSKEGVSKEDNGGGEFN
jgi:hypothetical protein